jgi:cell shape-determining protein MreC
MPLSRNANSYTRRNSLIPSAGIVGGGIILAIAVLIFIVHLIAPGILGRLARPFWNMGTGGTTSAQTFASLFGNSAALTRDRDRLVAENLALHEENRTLAARLGDLSRLAGERSLSGIVAGVLARPPVSPYDTLVVAAGKAQGVSLGQFAYAAGGVPIGTVETVSDTTSRIELFSRGGRVTEGWVGEKRIPITLTGKGGGAFEATLPRDSGVELNAVVYVPGPGALPIGSVARIDSNPSSPRDIVHIAPYVNLFSLTWIEISHP